jgi:hypothetical protein
MFLTEHHRGQGAEWIAAGEALRLAMRSYGGAHNAQEFLVRRAGADLILTRCRTMRCEKRTAQSQVIERDDCFIAPDFWEQFAPRGRRTLVDWTAGDFKRTMEGRLGGRDIVLVIGVEFSRQDLLRELPTLPVEWIPASTAYDLLDNANVGDLAVAICSRAFEGLVRATAQKFTWEDRPGRNGSGKHEKLDCEVPPKFWWAKGFNALESNWDTGDFSTWIDQTYEWKAFGVQFAKADIEAMLPKRIEQPAAQQAEEEVIPSSGGEAVTSRARNLAHDHPFAAAMAALKLAKISADERARLTGPSVGKTMEEYYRDSHKGGKVPHSDNLDEYGASVLKALKQIWSGTQ